MKLHILATTSALLLAGCGAGAPYTVARLNCPASEGDLRRVSQAEDGTRCAYRSSEGAEVELTLLPVDGDADTALAQLETTLVAAANAPPQLSELDAAPERPVAPVPSSDAAATAAEVRAQAYADSGGDAHPAQDAERPIRTADSGRHEGEVTRIDLPGLQITARDDDAKIRIGPVRIDASDDTAKVRMYRHVRMKGEQLSREKRGVRATFVYAGKDLPTQYRYVGYQAAGPRDGPLVVGLVRSRQSPHAADNIKQDVEKLVRTNARV